MNDLFLHIKDLIHAARQAVIRKVNTLQVFTNFEIGRCIVLQEQQGDIRAEYGKALLKELSARLTEEFGRGVSRTNLEYMRNFILFNAISCPRNPRYCLGYYCQVKNPRCHLGFSL